MSLVDHALHLTNPASKASQTQFKYLSISAPMFKKPKFKKLKFNQKLKFNKYLKFKKIRLSSDILSDSALSFN